MLNKFLVDQLSFSNVGLCCFDVLAYLFVGLSVVKCFQWFYTPHRENPASIE